MLEKLPKLRRLYLHELASVGDEGLWRLEAARDLEVLDIWSLPRMTDATIGVDTSSATLRCTIDGGALNATCDNPVVLTGDIHSNWANELRVDDRRAEFRLVIDERSRTVSLDDRPVELSRKEFDLLNMLLRRKGTVVYTTQLYHTVWGHGGQSAAAVDAHTVKVHVS